MMQDLTIKAKAIMATRDTTANWALHPLFIPRRGQIIVYEDYASKTDDEGNTVLIPNIKIGDGKAYLPSLPFIGCGGAEEILQELHQHEADDERHVTEEDRTFWNNKLNYTVDPATETLILNRN